MRWVLPSPSHFTKTRLSKCQGKSLTSLEPFHSSRSTAREGREKYKGSCFLCPLGVFPVVGAAVRLGGASRGCPFLRASRVDQGRPGAQDRSLLQGPPGRKAGIRPLLGRPPADLGLICAIPPGWTAILRRLLSVQRFALQASCSLVPLSGGRLHLKVALGFSRSKVAAVTPEELPCGLRARAVEKVREAKSTEGLWAVVPKACSADRLSLDSILDFFL